jgi:hypothetical protein
MITPVQIDLQKISENYYNSIRLQTWPSFSIFKTDAYNDYDEYIVDLYEIINHGSIIYDNLKGSEWPDYKNYLYQDYLVSSKIKEELDKFDSIFITSCKKFQEDIFQKKLLPIREKLQKNNTVFVAGGDSFIFGNELTDWAKNPRENSNLTFSKLLSNVFGMKEYVCVARPGNSNDAIMRMIIKKCDQLLNENKKIAVIASWTFPPRFEFPFAYRIDSPDHTFASISIWPETNRPMVQSFAKTFMKNIEIDWFAHFKTVQSIVILQTYLNANKIPYMFTAADNIVYQYKDDKQLKPYWDLIDWNHWYMFPKADEPWNTNSPRGFFQWAVENKYPIGPQQHPLEQAHSDAAHLMKDKLYELVKKTLA